MHSLFNSPVRCAAKRKRRVLIVDDHWFFAACLRTFVDEQTDFAVCDVAASSEDLSMRIGRLQPDLLVIDLALGRESGIELGARIRAEGVHIPILFVSTLSTPSRAQLDAVGACAFSPKSKRPAHFLRVLRATLASREKGFRAPREVGLTQLKSLA